MTGQSGEVCEGGAGGLASSGPAGAGPRSLGTVPGAQEAGSSLPHLASPGHATLRSFLGGAVPRSLTATTRKRKWQWCPGHVGPRQRDPIFASSHSDPYPSTPAPGFSCSPCLSDKEAPHPRPLDFTPGFTAAGGPPTWQRWHPTHAPACGRKCKQGKQGPGVNEASFALFLSFFLSWESGSMTWRRAERKDRGERGRRSWQSLRSERFSHYFAPTSASLGLSLFSKSQMQACPLIAAAAALC